MRAMLGGDEPKIPRVDGGENGGLGFFGLACQPTKN